MGESDAAEAPIAAPTQSVQEPPAKRRRTRLEASCERCRIRKIRCDKNEPKCEACERAEAVCDRTKPANRSKKARSSSTDSGSIRRRSKSPSSSIPKLYPVGDGSYAPLELIQSLRRNYNSHHPGLTTERPSLGSFNDNNSYTERQLYDQPTFFNHNRPDQVTSLFDDNGGNDFPTSTARLPAMGPGGGMQGNYGSMSSRIDPMLLPPIGPYDLDSETVSNTHNEQHSSNGGPQMPSMLGNSSQLSTLRGDTNGMLANDKTSYMNGVEPDIRSGTLSKHQLPEQSSSRYSSYNPFTSASQEGNRASDSELAFTPDDNVIMAEVQPIHQNPVQVHDRREDDYLIHMQDYRKKFLGASSSQVFVKWLDEESGGMNPSSFLKHGMASAEEMIIPGQLELCHHPLPPQPELETYVSTYFRTFHIIYPVLDESWLRSQLTRPKGPQTAGEDFVTPVVYLVVSLGASMTASSHQSSAVSKTYLDQAWKALSVILGRPFRSSVQALILLAVAFRLRSKDGVAWGMIGSAIRISQSLGLHRHTVGPEASLDARIWYAAMSLDAIGSIESGRPMTIRRSDYSASLTSFKDEKFAPGPNIDPINVLGALAELCQEIAYIVQVLFPTNPATSSVYEIEVLEHIGVIHMRLENWAKNLPLQIRPGGDRPVLGPYFPFAALLHMQYHQIIITLHRLSLIDHPRLVLQNLNHPLLRGRPFLHCLESSESICTQSARAILTTLDASARKPTKHHYWTFHSIGSAIFALSLFTCKHPTTWQARSDVEMLSHATRYITKGFLDQGLSPQFVNMYEAVNQMTRQKVLDNIEAQSPELNAEETLQLTNQENALGTSTTSIEELWSTLFGISSTTENDIPLSLLA